MEIINTLLYLFSINYPGKDCFQGKVAEKALQIIS